jgi:hypothetical protein
MLAGEAAGGVHRGSAPRSESLILVIAGGNHTIIYKAHFRSASPMPISLVTFLFGDKKVTLPYLLIYEKVYFLSVRNAYSPLSAGTRNHENFKTAPRGLYHSINRFLKFTTRLLL